MAMETAAQGCLQHQHQEDLPQENTGIAVHLLHRETTTTGIGELRVVEVMTGNESESERGRHTAVEVVHRGTGRPFEGSLPHHRLVEPLRHRPPMYWDALGCRSERGISISKTSSRGTDRLKRPSSSMISVPNDPEDSDSSPCAAKRRLLDASRSSMVSSYTAETSE